MLREGHRPARAVQPADPARRDRVYDADCPKRGYADDRNHPARDHLERAYFHIGAEAILPVNKASGRGFGGVMQFHVYLDDLFPRSLGKPISEW